MLTPLFLLINFPVQTRYAFILSGSAEYLLQFPLHCACTSCSQSIQIVQINRPETEELVQFALAHTHSVDGDDDHHIRTAHRVYLPTPALPDMPVAAEKIDFLIPSATQSFPSGVAAASVALCVRIPFWRKAIFLSLETYCAFRYTGI